VRVFHAVYQNTLKTNLALLYILNFFHRYMSDAEYIETINIPGDNSFDVRVTGGWELRNSVSLFTGRPSTVLKVTPEMVYYGPTKQIADYWKSLGPMSSTDLTYLDDDLRIMRGTTSTDSIFILQRSSN